LQQVMERASILAEGGCQIRPEHLYFSTVRRAGLAREELTAGAKV